MNASIYGYQCLSNDINSLLTIFKRTNQKLFVIWFVYKPAVQFHYNRVITSINELKTIGYLKIIFFYKIGLNQ